MARKCLIMTSKANFDNLESTFFIYISTQETQYITVKSINFSNVIYNKGYTCSVEDIEEKTHMVCRAQYPMSVTTGSNRNTVTL